MSSQLISYLSFYTSYYPFDFAPRGFFLAITLFTSAVAACTHWHKPAHESTFFTDFCPVCDLWSDARRGAAVMDFYRFLAWSMMIHEQRQTSTNQLKCLQNSKATAGVKFSRLGNTNKSLLKLNRPSTVGYQHKVLLLVQSLRRVHTELTSLPPPPLLFGEAKEWHGASRASSVL